LPPGRPALRKTMTQLGWRAPADGKEKRARFRGPAILTLLYA
jgi:hypothetical protein